MAKHAGAAKRRPARTAGSSGTPPAQEGWHGWDDYADFYDWENARTLGRRDLPFWRTLLQNEGARSLELGCGTGDGANRSNVAIRGAGIDRDYAIVPRDPDFAGNRRNPAYRIGLDRSCLAGCRAL